MTIKTLRGFETPVGMLRPVALRLEPDTPLHVDLHLWNGIVMLWNAGRL